MGEDSGAPLSGTGFHASHEAPDGSSPIGFNPSRGIVVTLSPSLLERLTQALSLAEITTAFGHGPGGGGKGDRVAGWYYQNDAAARAGVLPAHCIGAARDVILALGLLTRDTDRSGGAVETPQVAQPEARAGAGEDGIAPTTPGDPA